MIRPRHAPHRRLRRHLVRTAAAVLFLAVATAACGSGDDTAGPGTQGSTAEDGATAPLPAREIESGAVTVSITPRRLDEGGATFDLVLDTHEVELDMDLTAATLDVDGSRWPNAGWEGDGPSGHHRKATLRFTPNGDPSGVARLVLPGFPGPVEASWQLPAG